MNAQRSPYLYSKLYTYSKKYIPYKFLEKIGLKDIYREKVINFFLRYGLPLIFAFLAFLITYPNRFYLDKTIFYIFYLIIVLVCAGIGGISSAYLVTGLISITTFLSFKDQFFATGTQIDLYIQLLFFIISSAIAALLIEYLYKQDYVSKLKEQEKIYAQSFLQLNDDLKKAKNEIKSRDEFLSVVSHELRTPLTTMLLKLRGMLENIRSVSLADFSVPQLLKVLQNSELQIKRLTTIINDLLDVSLITTGRMNLEKEKIDLVKLTKKVLESFSEVLKAEKYKVILQADSAVIGRYDKLRMEQVVTNLISNAIKFGLGKPINISISRNGNLSKIVVKDHGLGIALKEQRFIFNLFKQTEWSKEHTNGLGVGLYIAIQIIKSHGGRIRVTSMQNKGSTFTVELPIENGNKI